MWELVVAASQLRRTLEERASPMDGDVRRDLHDLLRQANGMLQDDQRRVAAAGAR